MILQDLIHNIGVKKIVGSVNIDISNICFDSSKVTEGSLFVCLKGKRCDGVEYADIAIASGAVAVVCMCDFHSSVATVIKVGNDRRALSQLAINFYNNPAKSLKLIGVVGTNGKTTTSYITAHILKQSGYNVGLIGTMYYEYSDKRINSQMTTPDPIELQSMLRDMVDDGVEYVVMEVSAHAIYLEKIWGMVLDIAIFTNLTQDHLDFFGNMDEYKRCKKSIFCPQFTKMAIINVDDECGKEIMATTNLPIISYGLNSPSEVFAIDIHQTLKGTSYACNIMDEIINIDTALLGEFNVYNALASFVVARLVDISCKTIQYAMNNITSPEGRFNYMNIGGVSYVVDFAHTPDGLYNLLKETKKLCTGRLITIFGCGGDRDITKRPLMGKIASEMSDIVIVTTDNPRTECRKSIVGDILAGIRLKGKLFVELDRGDAIRLGAEIAEEGDVIVVAGKGSENYIDENNIKIPYSDMEEIKRLTERAI